VTLFCAAVVNAWTGKRWRSWLGRWWDCW